MAKKEKKLKIVRRRSKIHGNGVFAIAPIRKGEYIVEYKGKLITHEEADQQYANEIGSGHTFLFTLNEDWIVDANQGGNVAKWINTGCEPNAVAFIHSENKKKPDPKKDRVLIEALRAIKPGEEIIYDYGFVFDVPYTVELLRLWGCLCGSPKCRGTMLKGRKVREVIKANPDWRTRDLKASKKVAVKEVQAVEPIAA